MFTDFQSVWTPVFLRKHLRNKPVKLTIAGEPIVLFRNTGGVTGALLDRCPHRGVALSLGRRTADGFLKCAFHGWEFDTAGVCQHVPFNAQAKRDNLCATTFPVYEGGGLIWLYTEPTRQPVAPPIIPEGLSRADLTLFHSDVLWQAHWTRVMENMMDNAHVPFVHRRTIGWALQRALRRDSRLLVTSEPTATGLMIKGVQDDAMIVGVHGFNRPNGIDLHLPGNVVIHVFCIPVDATSSRLLVVGDFGRRNWLAQLFAPLNTFIGLEDRAIVESSQPAEVPPPGTECSVATDRGTLGFRKYYYDVLKDKQSPPATLRVV